MQKEIMALALLTLMGMAHAGNRVDPSLIQYRKWEGAKPNVMAIVSGQVNRRLWVYWSNPYNVQWSTLKGDPVAAAQRDQLCELISKASDGMCQGSDRPRIEIRELFLGAAADFRPGAVSDEGHVGIEALAGVPPGAKRVLHLAVGQLGNRRMEVVAIAFDDVTDDVLRQIAYEDGVLRALYYRED
jgi:hypothetical protein